MNREVIKRYKKEFDHWLENGSDSIMHRDLDLYNKWQSMIHLDWGDDGEEVSYLINDEYIDLRIAEAEGKTIQFNIDNKWVDHLGRCEFSFQVKDYRVKPETVTKWQWIIKRHDGNFGITNGYYATKKDAELMIKEAIEPYLPSAKEFEV